MTKQNDTPDESGDVQCRSDSGAPQGGSADTARRLILERRKRFMASALAGLSASATGCEASQQEAGAASPEEVASPFPPEDPRVCLMIPGTPPSVCLSPMVTPGACLSMEVPGVRLSPPITDERDPQVGLRPDPDPDDDEDAGTPFDDEDAGE